MCGPGEPNSLTPAELAERNVDLAKAAARKAARRWPHLADEFESECMFLLLHAASTYDPSRGCAFEVHAGWQFKNAVKSVLLASRPRGYRRAADRGPGVSSLTGRIDRAAPGPDGSSAAEARDLVARAWDALDDRQRAICRRIYWGGETVREAAPRVGLKRSRADQIHREALRTMRAALGGDDAP